MTIVHRFVIPVLLLILPSLASGDDTRVDRNKKVRTSFVVITALAEAYSIRTPHTPIPYFGLGHFAQKKWLQGLAHLSSQSALWFARKHYADRVGTRDRQSFPNRTTESTFFPRGTRGYTATQHKFSKVSDLAGHSLFYGRFIDVYSVYRTLHTKTDSVNHIRMRDESIASLLASPFKFRSLKSPWVLVPVAIAGISTFFVVDRELTLSKVQRIKAFDRELTPNEYATFEGGIEVYRYLLVGVGEELYFRGIVQTELAEYIGPNPALVLSSLLFGAWHIPHNGVGSMLPTTAIGLYLGYRYKATGYDLSEPVALHFWLNWVRNSIELVCNPRGGRFVYEISWKI